MEADISPWSSHGYVVLGDLRLHSLSSLPGSSHLFTFALQKCSIWQITLRLEKVSKLSCYPDSPRYERTVGAVLRYDVKRPAGPTRCCLGSNLTATAAETKRLQKYRLAQSGYSQEAGKKRSSVSLRPVRHALENGLRFPSIIP